MKPQQTHLDEVFAAPEGAHIAALFDFDGTVIAGYSATAMLWERLKRREMSAEEIVDTVGVITQYSLGRIGFSGLMTGAAKFMRGLPEQSYIDFAEELYAKQIARKVYPETRALIRAHLAKGHTVAIVSSATRYQVAPAALDLDIEHVLCSQFEVGSGEFTGKILRPVCYGKGKVTAAEKLAAEHGLDLGQSFFYTDGDEDLPLLERVGHPRPLNANDKLSAIAAARGWPVQRFDSRGRASAMDYVRTILATGTMAGSALAALPIKRLTGSKREAVNFALSMFGDVGSALVGIELEVRGEKNLWVERPAIFIFNHQSKADAFVLAKLLRRDLAGVAKREARAVPVLGKMLELAGIIFIDRADRAGAIKSMEPLIEAMRVQGKSIIIAPEGTRTLTPKLGPFKKGAFHMAMQAGVPLVPIVIHNASDVAPKHEFVMRPAKVRVDVLPPIDVSKWSVKDLDRHIADVRKQFLHTLGQAEARLLEPPAGKKKRPAKAR